MRVNLGGMPVIHPPPITLALDNFPFRRGITLISDTHIGSSIVDYGLIATELEQAQSQGDRILLGGDIFDLILPSDKKRYRPDALHPRIRGGSNVLNAVLDWAEEIFRPYADRIDMIGIGNHEDSVLHRHHLDAVEELVRRLNTHRREPGQIAQAGWTSFVEYRVQLGKKRLCPYVIWYHHGVGRTPHAHRALRALQERAIGFRADLYWSGHTHARGQTAELQMRLVDGRLVPWQVRHVLTGSYMLAYQDQSQESMRKHGRQSNYAVESGYQPHALGGSRVLLTWDQPGFPKVEVIQ